MDGGNYIEKAGGSITETSQNDYTIYSECNIITNAKNGINEVGEDNGVAFGDAKSAPKKNNKIKDESKNYTLPLLIGYSKGFDYTHHYMSSKNEDLKKISLSQKDSTFGLGGIITIKDCDNMQNISEMQLKKNMLELMHSGTLTNNGMRDVAEKMVDHFFNNIGGEFENDTLESIVANDENFIVFVKRVTYKILIKLKSINWDLSKLSDTPDLVRFDNVAFNTSENQDDGLTITIDAVEHIEVYIVEYTAPSSPNGLCYLKIKLVLYDTFGLDSDDIKKYGKRNNTSAWRHITDWDDSDRKVYIQNTVGYGFTSWWLLQHRFNHKPFINKIILECEGHYGQKDIYRNPTNYNKTTANDFNYQ